VTPSSLALLLALAAPVAAPAPAASPAVTTPAIAAREDVARQSRQVEVYLAARERLVGERAALQARADGLAAQVAEAKRNRGVLTDTAMKARLAESLEVGRALEATDRKVAVLDRMLEDAVAALERSVSAASPRLSGEDRKALSTEVASLRRRLPSRRQANHSTGVQVTSGMDAEALRERADLARDYEDKLRRELDRAETRIKSLEAQQGMAGEARALAEDRRLFDEDDRSLRATRVVQRAAAEGDGRTVGRSTAAADGTGWGGATTPPGAGNTGEGGGTTPAAGGTELSGAYGTEDDTAQDPSTRGGGSNAAGSFASDTARGATVSRAQTVVDERTFALLRESRTPSEGLSAAEELRRLRERRAALARAAERLRDIQEDLRVRATAPHRSSPTDGAP
jgi:hypothetical protein